LTSAGPCRHRQCRDANDIHRYDEAQRRARVQSAAVDVDARCRPLVAGQGHQMDVAKRTAKLMPEA
jgi:hypothetical protein